MSQLMETLFTAMHQGKQLEEEARATREANEAIRAAEQRLTLQEFDDLWSAAMNIDLAGELDIFTLGFRLGMQLTLEGLRYPTDPAASEDRPYPPR